MTPFGSSRLAKRPAFDIEHPRGSRFFCEAPGGLLFEINTRCDAAEVHRRTFDSQVAQQSTDQT